MVQYDCSHPACDLFAGRRGLPPGTKCRAYFLLVVFADSASDDSHGLVDLFRIERGEDGALEPARRGVLIPRDLLHLRR